MDSPLIVSNSKLPTTKNDFDSIRLSLGTQISNDSKQSTKSSSPEIVNLARKYQLYGVCSFICSCAMIKVAIENFQGDKFPQYVYVSFRLFFLSAVCYLMIKNEGNEPKSLFQLDSKWMMIRSVIWFISFWFYALSVEYLKLGLTTLLIMTSPILQNITFSIYFKTKLNMKYIYSCLICLFGVYLIFQSSHNSNKDSITAEDSLIIILGIFYGLLNALAIAILYISVKNLNETFDSTTINYISGFWGGVIALVVCLILTPHDLLYFFDISFIFYLILIGLFSSSGFHYINLAIITADISKSSYIMYLQLPALGLFGMIFYNESYILIEYIGFAIIIVVSIYTSKYLS